MEQHSLDLLRAAWWLITCIGALGLATIIWGGKQVLERLEKIESLLASEVRAIRESLNDHDVRIARIETKCDIAFSGNSHPMRRATDKEGNII